MIFIKKCSFIVLGVIVLFCVCLTFYSMFNISYDEIDGYEVYVSESDDGYKYAPYFGARSILEKSVNGRNYYNKNIRRCGRYLITDYEEGICINRYYPPPFSTSESVDIPETLDGKPVIKLGGYIKRSRYGNYISYNVISAFAGTHITVLNIPSTIKYISWDTLHQDNDILSDEDKLLTVHIGSVNVDEKNSYYFSENGILFTKDKKKLLYMDYANMGEFTEYKVPDYVEIFEPMDGIIGTDGGLLIFGKNIRQINTFACDIVGQPISDIDEYDDFIPLTVKGYKGTVAEEWAEKYNLKFVPLD